MRSTYFITAVLSATLPFSSLPNWRQKSELATNHVQTEQEFKPPTASFRVPAEYEPISAVIVGFKSYSLMLSEIARQVTTVAGAELWAVMGPKTITGVNNTRYKTFDYSLDSVWMRDYGPVGLLESDDKVGSLDTIYRHYQYRLKDDKLPTILSNFNRMPVYDTPIILGTQI